MTASILKHMISGMISEANRMPTSIFEMMMKSLYRGDEKYDFFHVNKQGYQMFIFVFGQIFEDFFASKTN